MKTFTYYINLDEREEFFADVRDCNEQTIWAIHTKDAHNLWDIERVNAHNIKDITHYLKELAIINTNDQLVRGN